MGDDAADALRAAVNSDRSAEDAWADQQRLNRRIEYGAAADDEERERGSTRADV